MYAYLDGILAEIEESQIVIDVSGIGYLVNVPKSVLSKLPTKGGRIKLYVTLIVREDSHELYGFLDKNNKVLFKMLIEVSGIGPKASMSVLSSISVDDLILSIATGDEKILTRVPGIGKKTAQRIILELKDKIDIHIKHSHVSASDFASKDISTPEEEALHALLALGYDTSEAYAAIRSVSDKSSESTDLIKAALKVMIKK